MLNKIRTINNQGVLLTDDGATRRDMLKIYLATNRPDEEFESRKKLLEVRTHIDRSVANGEYLLDGHRMLVLDLGGKYWWSVGSRIWRRR